ITGIDRELLPVRREPQIVIVPYFADDSQALTGAVKPGQTFLACPATPLIDQDAVFGAIEQATNRIGRDAFHDRMRISLQLPPCRIESLRHESALAKVEQKPRGVCGGSAPPHHQSSFFAVQRGKISSPQCRIVTARTVEEMFPIRQESRTCIK